jgi:hypothetical protein
MNQKAQGTQEALEEQAEKKSEASNSNIDNDGIVGDNHVDEINDFLVRRDSYRHVMFGQIADGLVPPHSGEPESTDAELSQAALSDSMASELEKQNTIPTPWRAIAVITLIAAALAIVFWKK